MRKPFYRRDRGCWYVKTPNGNNQVRLQEDESEAYRIWNEMMQTERPEVPNATVAVIAENFLQHCERRIKASTLSSYSRYLTEFCDLCGRMPVRELKGLHVIKWLHDTPTWGVASQQ